MVIEGVKSLCHSGELHTEHSRDGKGRAVLSAHTHTHTHLAHDSWCTAFLGSWSTCSSREPLERRQTQEALKVRLIPSAPATDSGS